MDFFKSAFGNDVFTEFPEALDVIAIASVKVAENAGNLTKVGNGPNFSQEQMTVVGDGKFAQGISIEMANMKMSDTLPNKNYFASVGNIVSVGFFSQYVSSQADYILYKRLPSL